MNQPPPTPNDILMDPSRKARKHRKRHVPVGPAGLWYQSRQLPASRRSDNDKDEPSKGGLPFYSPVWTAMQIEMDWTTPATSRPELLRPYTPTTLLSDLRDHWRIPRLVVLVHAIHCWNDLWTVTLTDETHTHVEGWLAPTFDRKECLQVGSVWWLEDVTATPDALLISKESVKKIWTPSDTVGDAEYLAWTERRRVLTQKVQQDEGPDEEPDDEPQSSQVSESDEENTGPKVLEAWLPPTTKDPARNANQVYPARPETSDVPHRPSAPPPAVTLTPGLYSQASRQPTQRNQSRVSTFHPPPSQNPPSVPPTEPQSPRSSRYSPSPRPNSQVRQPVHQNQSRVSTFHPPPSQNVAPLNPPAPPLPESVRAHPTSQRNSPPPSDASQQVHEGRCQASQVVQPRSPWPTPPEARNQTSPAPNRQPRFDEFRAPPSQEASQACYSATPKKSPSPRASLAARATPQPRSPTPVPTKWWLQDFPLESDDEDDPPPPTVTPPPLSCIFDPNSYAGMDVDELFEE